MSRNPTLSVIIPTYNEAENIEILIPRISRALAKVKHEIIIADDNSPDQTYAKALELKKKFKTVRAICRMHNRGLSPAVIDGFQIALGKYLVVMDADLQHDEKILPRILSALEAGADLVVASRKIAGGGYVGWSWTRRFISWGASMMAKMLFPRLPSDPMSGYFALTAELFRRVAPSINPRGFKILLEIVAKTKNIKVDEVGYVFRSREHGESKLTGSVMLQYVVALTELRFGGFLSRQYIQFVLVGMTGILVNQSAFLILRRFFAVPSEIALLVAIETAILSNFIINNLFTFRDNMLRGFTAVLRGLFYFQLICLVGAYINYATALHLSHFLSIDIYLANTVGIIIASFWNYFLNAHIIWRKN